MIMIDRTLPKTLKNCPIVDSVVEVRFTSDLVSQAVFGVVYEKLKHKYPLVENLPITQFPQIVIDADVNLQNKPHYRLRGNSPYSIQIGPNVITIGPQLPYPGWKDSFSPTIKETLDLVYTIGIIKAITRVGIRYTNFFPEMDVFQKATLKIQFNDQPISYKRTILRTEIALDDFSNTLQVSNDATWQPDSRTQVLISGSLIDVDTFRDYHENGIDKDALLGHIEKGHEVEKIIFWNTLGQELRNHLQPIF
jgi:uncharacterized protein (TIGR04255 family)